MLIKVDANMLMSLCNPRFSYEACVIICNYMEDFPETELSVGDICIGFCENDVEDLDEEDSESIIGYTDHHTVVIMR